MTLLLKNEIGVEPIKKLALSILDYDSTFQVDCFLQNIFSIDWEALTLKQRIRVVTLALGRNVSLSYKETITILKPISLEFSGLFHFIFSDYVEVFGLEDFETSFDALEYFTQKSTAEFAIRAFIQANPEKTKVQLIKWSKSQNEHLRRLASEGVRPQLPWAKHIHWIAEQPEWVKPIIENLKHDKSRYVQKSVANLLNDLTKTQPEWVLCLAKQWIDSNCTNTHWIIKHALRTLLKQSHTEALNILGYGSIDHMLLSEWCLPNSVNMGEKLIGHFSLIANQAFGKLRIEYALSFLRKQKKPYRKVFKISEPNQALCSKQFDLVHDFKPISTRTYYPGKHSLELIINGQTIKTAQFELKP